MPSRAHVTVLQELHMGHPGKVAMLARAKKLFFWENMNEQVTAFAESCVTCAMNRPAQSVEPLQPRAMPTQPRETMAADFFSNWGEKVLSHIGCFFPVSLPVACAVRVYVGAASRVSGIFPSYGVSGVLLV